MIVMDIETCPLETGEKAGMEPELNDYMRSVVQDDFKYNGIGKGVTKIETIERKKADPETILKSIKLRSLSPDFGKIVSIGMVPDVYIKYKTGEPTNKKRKAEVFCGPDEKSLIKAAWQVIDEYGSQTIGFNTINFDIPYFIARSSYQGVVPSANIMNRGRYAINPAWDMLQIFSNWKTPTAGLKFGYYLELYNLPSKKDEFSGADVFPAYRRGDFARIKEYSADDCSQTYDLFMRTIKYYSFLMDPVKTGSTVY